ncbi:hypothetical protein [Oceanibaculum nanhaiense]|uniref:hypothetical protein n=1 Tax=Oceanibaculum nanhaiense TaxID=1909734 RepID=UPI003D272761
MSDNHSHRVSSFIPPVFSRFVGDEDLSAAGDRPSPCFYSRISDEDLSAASAPPPCGGFPCRISDEDLSAAGSAARPPVGPCVTTCWVGSDEDLSAAGLSAAGTAKCRPLGCVIGDEDISSAGMVRPTPNCSCYVSDADEELLADSGQSH